MKIEQIREILDASVLCGHDCLDREIFTACAADLMSDVLAFVKNEALLFTGLTNTQVIHTADMMDISCIVFVRGKRPSPEIIAYAEKHDMVLLSTPYKMYPACGKLYASGMGV